MTDFSSSFLMDICDNPHDDGLRLICADYYEENGEEARSEFIRLQIEAAPIEKWLDDNAESKARPFQHLDRLEEIEKRTDELLFQHGHRWCTPFARAVGIHALTHHGHSKGVGAIAWAWKRGFINELHLPLQAFLRGKHKEIITAAPLEIIKLTDRKPHHFTGNIDVTERHMWQWYGHAEEMYAEPHRLPKNIIDILYKARPEGHLNKYKDAESQTTNVYYDTQKQAEKALSDAALAWMRDQP